MLAFCEQVFIFAQKSLKIVKKRLIRLFGLINKVCSKYLYHNDVTILNQALNYVAESERIKTAQSQADSIGAVKARGVKFGR